MVKANFSTNIVQGERNGKKKRQFFHWKYLSLDKIGGTRQKQSSKLVAFALDLHYLYRKKSIIPYLIDKQLLINSG